MIVGLGDAANRAVRVCAERPELVEAIVAPGGMPAGRRQAGGAPRRWPPPTRSSNAFLSMCETDYRGALRSLVTAGNPQMSEDEIRERARLQAEYQPQETAVARLRAWVDDDALEPRAPAATGSGCCAPESTGGGWFPAGAEAVELVAPALPRRARRADRGRDHRAGPT